MDKPTYSYSHTKKYRKDGNYHLFCCETCASNDVVELMQGNYKDGYRVQWCAYGHITILHGEQIVSTYNIAREQTK